MERQLARDGNSIFASPSGADAVRVSSAVRHPRLLLSAPLLALVVLLPALAFGQANGRLQIHFMDVWQGDGALLISPLGETVLFDNGVNNHCDRPVAYLDQLGITSIGTLVSSHYHADHIGCTTEVLSEFPLTGTAFDRGGSYKTGTPEHPTTFDRYVTAVGPRRQTAVLGSELRLDDQSATPVVIRFVAMNATTADGPVDSTDNENDLSLVAVIEYGGFRAEIGGDLSGFHASSYEDIEKDVSRFVRRIDVYKVHHHCSKYSTNDKWLLATSPRIGIVSCGDNNQYGHPTTKCLDRLHARGVRTYWTEDCAGGSPTPGQDVVSGTIIVEADAAQGEYTVTRTRDQIVDRFPFWSSGPTPPPGPGVAPASGFAWSRLSSKYHFANCSYVASISPQNLVYSATAPTDKALHEGCPR